MVLSISDSFKHEAGCKKKSNFDQAEIEKLILQSIQKSGLNPNEARWNDNGHLELKRPDNLKLHTFMLQLEELGLNLNLTKQTLIEIN